MKRLIVLPISLVTACLLLLPLASAAVSGFRMSLGKPFPPVQVQAMDTCQISCGLVRVYVNGNCSYEITPAEILGECFALFQGYVIVDDGVRVNPVSGGVIDKMGVFPYAVFNNKGGFVCVGQVQARDTIGPVFRDDVAKRNWETWDTLVLPERDLPLVRDQSQTWMQASSPLFLGIPSVRDGCGSGYIHRVVTDELISFPCDTLIRFRGGQLMAHLSFRITRTFTFIDNLGNRSRFVQEIFFRKVGATSSCDQPARLAFDYAPANLFAFGPLGDNPRTSAHPLFPVGTRDLTSGFYRCEAPDTLRFDVCSLSGSEEQERILRAVYSATYTWPNGKLDTISLFDPPASWRVSYASRAFSACNDGKRVRVILTIEGGCPNRLFTDTIWIYFVRVSGPSFPALDTTGGKHVLGRDARSPVRITLPLVSCKGSLSLPPTHGTDEADLGRLFNWTVRDICTPRANLNLSYRVESKVVPDFTKFRSSPDWKPYTYPMRMTGDGPILGDLPAGSHRLIIQATAGECEAVNADTLYFVMQDQVFPRARCKQSITLPFVYRRNADWYGQGRSANLYARLRIDMVNAGSTDNCYLDTFYMRRAVPEACILENMLGNADYDRFGNGDGKVTLSDFEKITAGKFAGQYYTPRFMPYVEYFCCDANPENTAELWVGDLGNGNQSNFSFCEVDVLLVDVFNPVILPPDLNAPGNALATNQIACQDTASLRAIDNELLANSLFGTPLIYGLDCSGKVTYSTASSISCGSGFITRRWTVEKTVGANTVVIRDSQRIFVRPAHNFSLSLPPDTTASCGSPAALALVVASNACDKLQVSYSDSLLSRRNQPAGCITVARTYTVINTCALPPLTTCDAVRANPGLYARVIPRRRDSQGRALPYFLSISQLNGDKQRVIGPGDPAIKDSLKVFSGLSRDSLSRDSLARYPLAAIPSCPGEPAYAWQYTQMLTLTDQSQPVVPVPDTAMVIRSNASCANPVRVRFRASDNCPFATISLDSAMLYRRSSSTVIPWGGKWGSSTYEGGFLEVLLHAMPAGNYDLWVQVSDNCGQLTRVKLPVLVIASEVQVLDCVASLRRNLQPQNPGDTLFQILKVGDLLKDPTFPARLEWCSPASFLALKRVSDIPSGSFRPTRADSFLILSCADLRRGTVPLRLMLADTGRLVFSCDVSLVLTDTANHCGATYLVQGTVLTKKDRAVSGLGVQLTGSGVWSGLTDALGTYVLDKIPGGRGGELKPVSPLDFRNGISTLDLVLLQRQLLQGNVLKNPYEFIAADLDNSKSVSIRDLVELRKLILGVSDRFEKNNSWRFVPSSYVFPDSLNPWTAPFPEGVTLEALSRDTTVPFIAVKIGDLSGDAPTQERPGAQFRREFASWPIYYEVVPGFLPGACRIDFYFEIRPDAFQATLAFPSALASSLFFRPGSLGAEYTSLSEEKGLLHLSAEKLGGNGPLFSLDMHADELPKVLVSFSRMGLLPEAYAGNRIYTLSLRERNPAGGAMRFLPPFPNPTAGEISLSFYLPGDTPVSLTLTDLTGKSGPSRRLDGRKGWNTYRLHLSDQEKGAVWLCALHAGDQVAVQRIIVVK